MTSSNCMTRCRRQICRVLLSAAETRDLPRAAAVRMDRGRRPRARDYIVGVVESAAAYTDQTVQFVAVGLTGRHNARPLSCWKVAITYASVVRQQPIEHNVITFPTPSVSAGARAAPGARRPSNSSIRPPGCPRRFDDPNVAFGSIKNTPPCVCPLSGTCVRTTERRRRTHDCLCGLICVE